MPQIKVQLFCGRQLTRDIHVSVTSCACIKPFLKYISRPQFIYLNDGVNRKSPVPRSEMSLKTKLLDIPIVIYFLLSSIIHFKHQIEEKDLDYMHCMPGNYNEMHFKTFSLKLSSKQLHFYFSRALVTLFTFLYLMKYSVTHGDALLS